MIRTSAIALVLLLASSCGQEEEKDGLINIKLEMDSSLQSASTDSTVTTVNYACVVTSATETTCMYYYNGVAQTGSGDSIGSTEASRGPGTSGYTFVESGTTVSGYEGGSRTYAASFASYQNGSTVSTPTTTSGDINLYAEKGKDLNWSVSFGTDGTPSTATF